MARIPTLASNLDLSKTERTRANLVRTSIDEFARRGYHNTKISDIVSAAGVAQPTFYAYFENKEVAYEFLIETFRARLKVITKSALMQADKAKDGGVDEVARALTSFLDFFMEDPELTRIGFIQDPARDETQAQLVSWITTNVLAEQKMGFFRDDIRATQVARFFVGMLDQMFRQAPNKKAREQMAREAALFACEGLWIRR